MLIKYLKDFNKAIGYLKKGEISKAISFYTDSIDNSKGIIKSISYIFRGRAYYKIKKYDYAFKDFLASVKIGTLPTLNLAPIATIYYTIKEYDKAFKYYSRVVELKPKSSLSYIYLGSFYYTIKEYDKAILNFKKALKFDRLHLTDDIQTRLGAVYIKIKEYDKAQQYLSKALKCRVNSAGFYSTCATLQKELGNVKLSKVYILKAIKLDYTEGGSYRVLAELNLIEDDFTDFYKNFEIFLSKKVCGIDYDEINDSIYDKVKNDEKFKLLIKNSNEKILTFKDLNISIDDDELLSSKKYKKTKNIFRTKIILFSILLISILSIVYKINTNCSELVKNLIYFSLLLILWLSTYIRLIMYVGVICFVIIGGAYYSTGLYS